MSANAFPQLNAALSGRYSVERELGAGGMATVYLAHDVRHDRKVALKLLRPELSAILGAARFLAEIKTTANLQHPHILSLFDSGEADGTVFYVMPYVEGESLRDRLKREHQLPIDEAVGIAREVLDALDYAHHHGIVHRDIKPENILLHGGHAMVMDFGIALAASRSDGGTRMTETGMSLGTPHYMSPEQAMGEKDITPKADIYALGCVLYEMLTGEPPFTGHSAQAIFARVLTDEPRSLTLQRKTIPTHIEAAVHHALEKLPADRYASASQFADALINPGAVAMPTGTGLSRATAAMPRRKVQIAMVAGVAVVSGLLGAGLLKWLTPAAMPPVRPVVRFAIAMPRDALPTGATGSTIAFAPDGSRIVYVGKAPNGTRLYSRGMDQLIPAAIAGTDGASLPFFSADGQFVGFRQGGRLMKVALAGGPALPIADARGTVYGATWTATDTLIFATNEGVMAVPTVGGTPKLIARPDSGERLLWPHILPGGRAIVLTSFVKGRPHLATLVLKSGALTRLDQPGGYPRYVSAGFLLLSDPSGVVSAVPFDADRLTVVGAAVPVSDRVFADDTGDCNLGVSNTGDIAFQSSISAGNRLVMVDRGGAVRDIGSDTGFYWTPRFAPNGRRVAALRFRSEIETGADIWVFDLAQRTRTRLTFDSTAFGPIWTPDGRHIVFAGLRTASTDFFKVPADGSGAPERFASDTGFWSATALESGGGALLYQGQPKGDSPTEIRRMPLGATKPGTVLVNGTFNRRNPSVSPDGKWMVYASNESGRAEVYARSTSATGGRWQVSLNGGTEPLWSPAGGEIFYRDGDAVMSATVRAQTSVEVLTRTKLFDGVFEVNGASVTNYDVSRDGKTFVMLQAVQGDAQAVNVMLNWFALRSRPR